MSKIELNNDEIIEVLGNANRDLCEEKEEFPNNYEDYTDQVSYVLRYSYAYSLEYFGLYKEILSQLESNKKINVLSIGAGNLIDSWSLDQALEYESKGREAKYVGIDLATWIEDYIPKNAKNVCVEKKYGVKAGDYFNDMNELDYDIYFFPKSIGDIGDDFNKIIENFKQKPLNKNKFVIAVSYVQYDKNTNRTVQNDKVYVDELIKTIKRKGFKSERSFVNKSESPHGLLKTYEVEEYPKEILANLEHQPILTESYVINEVITFSK